MFVVANGFGYTAAIRTKRLLKMKPRAIGIAVGRKGPAAPIAPAPEGASVLPSFGHLVEAWGFGIVWGCGTKLSNPSER